MNTIRIGLAPLRQPDSVLHGVEKIDTVLARCAAEQVASFAFRRPTCPGCAWREF